ncbi:MAG: nucleotidyltransferase family protein [Bacteroidota bacterium]
MKTKEQYIHLLSEFYRNRGFVYGIDKLGIFGSVARGEQQEGSDVDIYYEGEPLSLLKIAALKEELETTLGNPVDIVRFRKSMNNLLKKRIEKDGLYV